MTWHDGFLVDNSIVSVWCLCVICRRRHIQWPLGMGVAFCSTSTQACENWHTPWYCLYKLGCIVAPTISCGNILFSPMSQVPQNMRPKQHFQHAPKQQPCIALQYPARTSLPTYPRRSPTTLSLTCLLGTCLPSSNFEFCWFFARVTSGDMGMSQGSLQFVDGVQMLCHI